MKRGEFLRPFLYKAVSLVSRKVTLRRIRYVVYVWGEA